jgi:glycosyltransferase involved in cell wall biosynthesis
MRLLILFRSCSAVFNTWGLDKSCRPIGYSKGELAVRCFRSLARSVAQNTTPVRVELAIVDDHSDGQTKEALRQCLIQHGLPVQLHELQKTGNSNSLHQCYSLADQMAGPDDLIYFVEDDYAHAPSCISEMIEIFHSYKGENNKDCAVFPTDYPDYYSNLYLSWIYKGSRRHWRTVLNTTGTQMVSSATFQKYRQNFARFAQTTSENHTINDIYKEVACLAPLPSLTAHVTRDCISPYVDWEEWLTV